MRASIMLVEVGNTQVVITELSYWVGFFWYSYNIEIPELHSNNGLQTAGAIKLYVDRAARWMPFCAYLCDEQYMRQMSNFWLFAPSLQVAPKVGYKSWLGAAPYNDVIPRMPQNKFASLICQGCEKWRGQEKGVLVLYLVAEELGIHLHTMAWVSYHIFDWRTRFWKARARQR